MRGILFSTLLLSGFAVAFGLSPHALAADCPHWLSVMKFADGFERETAEDVVELGRDTFVDGVLWMCAVNPSGNPVLDRAADYAEKYRRVVPLVKAKSSLPQGVLLQATMGHGGFPGVTTPWQLCVRPDGRPTYRMCPMDERFLEYIAKTCRTFSALAPDFFMVDDDTRMVWNDETPGCFCPLHLTEFSRRTGRSWTKDEVLAMLKKGESEARQTWLDVKVDSLRRFFRTIRANFDSKIPGMLCICENPEHVRHAVEFATILAAPGQKPVLRGSGSPYHGGGDAMPFHLPMMIRQYAKMRENLGGNVVLMQEADTCPQTLWACSAIREVNHLAVLAMNGVKGAKIWITRNTPNREWKSNAAYRRVFRENDGVLRWAAKTEIALAGVVCPPVSRTVCDMGEKYLSHLGIPYRAGEPREGEVVALNLDAVKDIGADRLAKYLSGNVLLDGPAAQWLSANGFADDIGVRAKAWNLKTVQRHRLEGGLVAAGIRSSDLTDLSDLTDGAEVLTHLDNMPAPDAAEYVAPGSVFRRNRRGGRVVVFAYAVQGPTCVPYWSGYILSESYKTQLAAWISRLAGSLPGGVYYDNDGHALCQAGRTAGGEDVFALTLLGLDDDPAPEFVFDERPTRIERLANDGTWTAVRAEAVGARGLRLATCVRTQQPAVFRRIR